MIYRESADSDVGLEQEDGHSPVRRTGGGARRVWEQLSHRFQVGATQAIGPRSALPGPRSIHLTGVASGLPFSTM